MKVIGIGYGKSVHNGTLKQLAGTKGNYFHMDTVNDLLNNPNRIASVACGKSRYIVMPCS